MRKTCKINVWNLCSVYKNTQVDNAHNIFSSLWTLKQRRKNVVWVQGIPVNSLEGKELMIIKKSFLVFGFM